ncbi:MAG: glycosyltransferase family 87 protein [Phycisphaerae bacterium]
MIALDPDKRHGRRSWLPLIVAGAIYAVIICVVVVQRAESTSDFRDFWETANHFRQTGEISSELGVHNYLPFFTLFMTPWSLLPLRVAIVLFTLLSLGLFALTVALVETLLNGKLGPQPRKATLAALGLMLAYVHSCAVLGQVGLLLLFLVVATWFLVERGKEWAAGAALGLAGLIKLLPVVLIVFLLVKRRWRVAGVAIGVFVVFGFGLPLAGIGYEQTVAQHRAFYERAIKGHAAKKTIFAEKPQKAKYSNNSLPIVLRRLFSRVNGDPSESDPDRTLFVNFVDLPRGAIWWVYLMLMAVLVAASVGVSLRGGKPWPPTDPDAGLALRAQFGVWCCLMLIASPLLWTHYLPLAYWPLALVADRVERAGGESKGWAVPALLALLLWLVCVLLLAWPAARAAGAQLWSLVLLWAVVLTLSVAPPRRTAA